jgi:hypothetical protein
VSAKLDVWCRENNVQLAFIQPGKPTQNAFLERFNGSIRRELLNAYVFRTLSEVRKKAEEWRLDYNCSRPHQSLGFLTLDQYNKIQIPIKTEEKQPNFQVMTCNISGELTKVLPSESNLICLVSFVSIFII